MRIVYGVTGTGEANLARSHSRRVTHNVPYGLAVFALALRHRQEVDHAFKGVRNAARYGIRNEADDDHRATLAVQFDPLRRAHGLDWCVYGERKQCLIDHVWARGGARRRIEHDELHRLLDGDLFRIVKTNDEVRLIAGVEDLHDLWPGRRFAGDREFEAFAAGPFLDDRHRGLRLQSLDPRVGITGNGQRCGRERRYRVVSPYAVLASAQVDDGSIAG